MGRASRKARSSKTLMVGPRSTPEPFPKRGLTANAVRRARGTYAQKSLAEFIERNIVSATKAKMLNRLSEPVITKFLALDLNAQARFLAQATSTQELAELIQKKPTALQRRRM